MSLSTQSGAHRQVQFGDNTTDPFSEELKPICNSANEQYYHRMVDIERKMWMETDIEAQIEANMSEEMRDHVQRHVSFQILPTDTTRENIRIDSDLTRKGYYHRMVLLEKMACVEAENHGNSNVENQNAVSQQARRHVSFGDDVKLHSNDAKSETIAYKKRLYDRMVELEAKIWLDGKDKVESDPELSQSESRAVTKDPATPCYLAANKN